MYTKQNNQINDRTAVKNIDPFKIQKTKLCNIDQHRLKGYYSWNKPLSKFQKISVKVSS